MCYEQNFSCDSHNVFIWKRVEGTLYRLNEISLRSNIHTALDYSVLAEKLLLLNGGKYFRRFPENQNVNNISA